MSQLNIFQQRAHVHFAHKIQSFLVDIIVVTLSSREEAELFCRFLFLQTESVQLNKNKPAAVCLQALDRNANTAQGDTELLFNS